MFIYPWSPSPLLAVATLATWKAEPYLQRPVDGNDQRDVVRREPDRGQNDDHRHQAGLWDTGSSYAGGCCCDTWRKRERSKLHWWWVALQETKPCFYRFPKLESFLYFTEVPVFGGQEPVWRVRIGRTACPGLNSHPLPLQPWLCWGGSVLSHKLTNEEE